MAPIELEVAFWPGEADSPVCLMVDDLTDGWIDAERTGRPLLGNDWGAGCDEPGSAFARLRDGLLARHPEVKTTFFVPVARLADVEPSLHACHFRPIHERAAFRDFLTKVAADPRLELAYHGLEHGTPGPRADSYVPEFAGYASLDDALAGIERGKAIWRVVLGSDPEGGKFPAYAPGAHGEEAIARSGFRWWCCRWDRGEKPDARPGDFEPRFFGATGVVDVPSTLHTPRPLADRVWRFARPARMTSRRIETLLEGRDPITVQEHISWSRPDEGRQRPNLDDDAPALEVVFAALAKRPVWHATCGEIARYVEVRRTTKVERRESGGLALSYEGRQAAPQVSFALRGRGIGDAVALHTPEGDVRVPIVRRLADDRVATGLVPLRSGLYRAAN